MAVCVRYLRNSTLKERAVGFVETDNMTAAAISAKILEVPEPLQLDPGLCVGFGFDGASVMSPLRACNLPHYQLQTVLI